MAVTTKGNISNLVALGKMTIRVQFVNFSTGNVFDIKKITVQIRIFTFVHCMCIFGEHNVVPKTMLVFCAMLSQKISYAFLA